MGLHHQTVPAACFQKGFITECQISPFHQREVYIIWCFSNMQPWIFKAQILSCKLYLLVINSDQRGLIPEPQIMHSWVVLLSFSRYLFYVLNYSLLADYFNCSTAVVWIVLVWATVTRNSAWMVFHGSRGLISARNSWTPLDKQNIFCGFTSWHVRLCKVIFLLRIFI